MKVIERSKFTSRQLGKLQAVKGGERIADVRLLRKLQKLGVLVTVSDTSSFFNYVYSSETFNVEGVGMFYEQYHDGCFYPFVQKAVEPTIRGAFKHLIEGTEVHGRDFVIKDHKMFIYGVAVNPYIRMEFENVAFDMDTKLYGVWIRIVEHRSVSSSYFERMLLQLGSVINLTRLNRDGVFSEREPMYWITLDDAIPAYGNLSIERKKLYVKTLRS
jgi:hypothetical protein